MTHTYESLLEKNRQYLWNPFTQMKEYLQDDPVIIKEGHGIKLIDIKGKEYFDGYSSLWLNPHGHNHPKLNEAIKIQLDQIAHSTLLGSANIPAILLAERLVQISPSSLKKVFYADSGAAAVEIALKIAFLYWKHQGHSQKQTFITMKNAYHGDTIGAVSIGGIDLFHSSFGPLLFPTEKVPYPYPYRFHGTAKECSDYCLIKLKQLLEAKANHIAGLIVEPMVQGASGLIVMPKSFLKEVASLCKQYNILFIADEVATGLGRTGKMFACNHEGIEPDILTLGKMLTGGYLPVSATLTSEEIYNTFYGDWTEKKVFYHGHSYTGNQLGCAVALASLDLYDENQLIDHIQEVSHKIKKNISQLESLTHVGEVRQLGFMMGIELVQNKETKRPYEESAAMGHRVCKMARQLGLLTRPLGDVITSLPPLISTLEELKQMIEILHQAIQRITKDS